MGTLHTWTYANDGEFEAILVSLTYERNKSADSTTDGTVTLVREWRDMDTQTADDFIAALDSTVTDPKASGQTYTGSFVGYKPELIEESDRSATVRQTLTLAVTSGANSSSLKVTWYESQSKKVDLYYYWGNSVDQYEAALANWDTVGEAADSLTITPTAFSADSTGAGNFTVRVETRIYRDIDTASGTYAGSGQFERGSAFETSKEWQQLGLDPGTDTPRATTAADGLIKSVQKTVAPDDTQNIITNERQATTVDPMGQVKQIEAFQSEVTTTARSAAAREAEQSAQVLGQIKTTRSDQSEFQGRYDNTETVVTATAQDHVAEKEIRAFESIDRDTNRNQIARETEQSSQALGTIKTTRSTKNDFGLFDNEATTRTAVADAEVRRDKAYTALELRETLTGVNATGRATEDSSFTAGTIKTTRSDENEFGRFDNLVETRTATDNVADGTDTTQNAFEASSTVKKLHDTAEETGSYTAGTSIETVRNSVDEFGRFSTAKQTRTVTADVGGGTDASETALESRSAVKVIHDAAQETHTYAAGSIEAVRNDVDEFGNFTTWKETRTSKDNTGDGTDTTENIFEASSTVKKIHDTAEETGSFSAGTSIQTVRNGIDEFGRFTTSKQTRTVNANVAGGTDADYNKFETSSAVKVVHDTAQETGSQSDGTVISIRNDVDEFGNFSTRKLTRTSLNNITIGVDTTENKFEDVTTTKKIHDTAAETGTWTNGASIETVRNDMDEFGYYTTVKTERIGKSDVAVGTDTTEDAFSGVSTEKVVHGSVVTSTFNDGTSIETVRNDVDEFGAYTTSKVTDTATKDVDGGVDDFRNAYEVRTTTKVVNDSAAETNATPAAGFTKDVRNDTNRYGLTDTEVVLRQALPQDDVAEKEIRAFETIARDTARNELTRETEETVQTTGIIKSTRSAKNAFGVFDNSSTTRTATASADAGNVDRGTAFDTTVIVTARNEAGRETPTAFTTGQISIARSDQNDFGLFDNSITTITDTDDVDRGSDASESLFESSATLKKRHKTAAYTLGAFSAGTIVATRNEKDEFGHFTSEQRTRTSKPVSDTQKQYVQSARADTVITVDSGAAAGTGAPANVTTDTGEIRTNVDTKDAFGKFSTSVKVVTGNAQAVSKDYETTTGTVTYTKKKNQVESALTADLGALTGATRNTARFDENAFGLFDYEITKRETGGFAAAGSLYAAYNLTMSIRRGGVDGLVYVQYAYSNSTTTAAAYAMGALPADDATYGAYRRVAGWGRHFTGVKLMQGGIRQGSFVAVTPENMPGI